jgi:multidrug efflux pump subunit AcrA (membrane-fusion protein)
MMAFTVEEFRDLLRLLEERPEWRAELRRAVLTEELLTLPELVRTLAEAQQRTEVQMAALAEAQRRSEVQIAALAEAQRRSEDRLGRVEEHLTALAEAQRRTEVQMTALVEAQRRTEARLDIMTIDLADLKGDSLERRYREHGPAYFGRLVRRSRVLGAEEVMDLLEPVVKQGELSALEADEVVLAHLVIRGRRREDDTEVYLVVEVSWGVGPYDVERAAHRADLLRRAGVLALPVVAGKVVLPEAASRARELRVWQLTDGQAVTPG